MSKKPDDRPRSEPEKNTEKVDEKNSEKTSREEPEIYMFVDEEQFPRPGLETYFARGSQVEGEKQVSGCSCQPVVSATYCSCNKVSSCGCVPVCSCQSVCSCVGHSKCSCVGHRSCSCNSHRSSGGYSRGGCRCAPVH